MDKKNKETKRVTAPQADENTELAPIMEGTWLNRDFDSLFNQFQRSFEQLMQPLFPMTPLFRWPLDEAFMQDNAIDVEDYGDHYQITAELPGLSKDQVTVEVGKNSLEIRAERKNQSERKDKNLMQKEQSYSAFQRKLTLREEILPEKVESKMKNGILEITAPKKTPIPKEQLRKVPVEG